MNLTSRMRKMILYLSYILLIRNPISPNYDEIWDFFISVCRSEKVLND